MSFYDDGWGGLEESCRRCGEPISYRARYCVSCDREMYGHIDDPDEESE